MGLPLAELDAAILQAVITLLVLLLCLGLWLRTRRPYFGWWAVAWAFYLARLGAIGAFLGTNVPVWLYWHQVITGWTALALLWTSFVFARATPWRRWYLLLVLFPPFWSWIAIYRLQNFFLAAGPAVAFLSAATLVTGVVFLRYRRRHPSGGATVLAATFLLWAVHHLDYPILRARGVWTPWGYYLDILFTLGVGAGILLLVNHELNERLLSRTAELEHLSRRMVRQHEEERRRLSLALHDETAQVLASLKMQLGSVAERVEAPLRDRVERAMTLVDTSLRGLRDVTNALRPALLDDLGLLPALRSLIAEFEAQHHRRVEFAAPAAIPVVSEEAEVVVYRALQEGLSNFARHTSEPVVRVLLRGEGRALRLEIADAGPGFDVSSSLGRLEAGGHLGLTGMRERAAAVGGHVEIESAPGTGVRLVIEVPAEGARAP
ncbi:MAG: sensor histidine kinase [Gemmatimonadaceae bacterium]|nr:sensor histidine kinase [Gemmatimonadaceae bacterium]